MPLVRQERSKGSRPTSTLGDFSATDFAIFPLLSHVVAMGVTAFKTDFNSPRIRQ